MKLHINVRVNVQNEADEHVGTYRVVAETIDDAIALLGSIERKIKRDGASEVKVESVEEEVAISRV